MKSLRLMFSVTLMSVAALGFAQSDAKKSFDTLKALAGSWEGSATTEPKIPQFEAKSLKVSLRVTSSGNALMHEMSAPGQPDDPITMLYLEGERLMLTHYCDAGNRPRMTGTISADGKTVDFDFLDVAGNMAHGHMHHAAFTFIDANHHSEDWTFMLPGDKVVRAHLELQRTK